MNEKKYSSIDEIMEDWKKEIENLQPMEIKRNTLNNALNSERLVIKAKYDKIIEEFMNESTDE